MVGQCIRVTLCAYTKSMRLRSAYIRGTARLRMAVMSARVAFIDPHDLGGMMPFDLSQFNLPSKRQGLTSYVVPPLAAAAAVMFYAAPAAADSCSNLMTTLQLPNTTITLAQTYAAGQTVSGSTTAPVGLCRVAATVKPGPQSNVHFEVWIP